MFDNLPRYWDTYHEWILSGLKTTVVVGLIGIALGCVLALIMSYFRNYRVTKESTLLEKSIFLPIKFVCDAFIVFFRFTPVLVVAFFAYFVVFKDSQLPHVGFFTKAFYVGALVMTLTAAAYFAKAFEGGIKAVSPSQAKAAKSLGLSRNRIFFSIITPQAFKNVLPQASNEVINAMKATSVLSIIGLNDLVQKIGDASNDTFDFVSGYVLLLIIYFLISLALIIMLKGISTPILRRRTYA